MEQLGPLLENLKKNKFWVACGLCAVAMIGVFFWSSMTINADKKKLIAKHTATLNSVNGIMDQSFVADPNAEVEKAHPNQVTNQRTKEEIQKGMNAVWNAWVQQYKRQEDRLKWPTEHFSAEALEAFRRQLEPELWEVAANPGTAGATATPSAPKPGHGDIPERLRTQYRQFISDYMPEVAEIIGASWYKDTAKQEGAAEQSKADSGSLGQSDAASMAAGSTGISGSERGGAGQPGSAGYVKDTVVWDQQNQIYWDDRVSNYQNRNGNTEFPPTAAQIMAAQQDLWILEAIFNVIKEVNGDVKENDLVNIRRVDHVFTGQAAISAKGEVMRVEGIQNKTSNAAGGGQGGERTLSGSSRPTPTAPSAAAGQPFQLSASDDPIHGRYVNINFKPMSEAEIRKAATAAKLEADPEYSVAKRIPFRLAVEINEREIDRFLAACANSPFSIEVRQIRINKHIAGEVGSLPGAGGASAKSGDGNFQGAGGLGQTSGVGAAGAGGMNAGQAAIGGQGGAQRGGGTGGAGGAASSADIATRTDYRIKVEFSGIVKIYYKPRPELFNQQKDQDKKEEQNKDVVAVLNRD
jgi:hypothetical protein